MSLEITGKIRKIGETESIGGNGFTKRLLVIDTIEQFSQPLPIEFIKDKCSILDNYNVGDTVKVGVNLRGSEFNLKFYVSLNGWKINKEAPATDLPNDDNF